MPCDFEEWLHAEVSWEASEKEGRIVPWVGPGTMAGTEYLSRDLQPFSGETTSAQRLQPSAIEGTYKDESFVRHYLDAGD